MFSQCFCFNSRLFAGRSVLTGETDKPGTSDKSSSIRLLQLCGGWMLSEDAYAPIYRQWLTVSQMLILTLKWKLIQPYSQYLKSASHNGCSEGAPDIVHIKSGGCLSLWLLMLLKGYFRCK